MLDAIAVIANIVLGLPAGNRRNKLTVLPLQKIAKERVVNGSPGRIASGDFLNKKYFVNKPTWQHLLLHPLYDGYRWHSSRLYWSSLCGFASLSK